MRFDEGEENICGESFWCFNGRSSEVSVWFNYVGHWFGEGVYCTKDSVLIFKDIAIRSDYYEKLGKCAQIRRISPINCVVEQYNKVIDGQMFLKTYKPEEFVYKGNTIYKKCKFTKGADFSNGKYEGNIHFEDCEFYGAVILPSGNSNTIIRHSLLGDVKLTTDKDVTSVVIESSKISDMEYQSKHPLKELVLLDCRIDSYIKLFNSKIERLTLKNVKFRDLIDLGAVFISILWLLSVWTHCPTIADSNFQIL